jgi:hypothetical protein
MRSIKIAKLFSFICLLTLPGCMASAQDLDKEALLIHKCKDFTVTGKGDNREWDKASWNPLSKLDEGGETDESRFKILYSATGIYVCFFGMDNKITTTYDKDFEDLYKADVFEAFLQPDPQLPLYLEYEVNALDKELVLLIPNLDGHISGWAPWPYEDGRKVVKKTSVTGGIAAPGATIRSWSAELFFPYALLSPLSKVPPQSGTVWRANFCRLDYDSGKMIKWAWSPVEKTFHEFRKFRPVRFE